MECSRRALLLGAKCAPRRASALTKGPRQIRGSLATTNVAHACLRASSSAANAHGPRTSQPKSSNIKRNVFLLGLFVTGATFYYLSHDSPRPKVLNTTNFAAYTITARETISPTSFVITVKPLHASPTLPYLEGSHWRYPLWSVEFKHPQVQIARHYTPLPPRKGDDPEDGTLRFYIRTVGDGEMSNYLGRLGTGQEVWLRGPHIGLDVLVRLGDAKKVVFLAGGTGVVPALQTAQAVLAAKADANVDLLWAVRKREELQSSPPDKKTWWQSFSQRQPQSISRLVEAPSPVGQQIQELRNTYGSRFSVQLAVDHEGTSFDKDHISSALTPTHHLAIQTPNTTACQVHDQDRHKLLDEFESPGVACSCSDRPTGKNLFVVSGPEGFVAHYAGPRVWVGGKHTQGKVGGVVAQLAGQDLAIKRDWLVLKM